MLIDFVRIRNFITLHWLGASVAAIVLLLGVFAVLKAASNDADAPHRQSQEEAVPHVSVASVAALSAQREDLSFVGEVRSQNEAQLHAEATGEIRRVYVSAGDVVSAGTVLAALDADTERAELTTAQGALEAAEAALLKAQRGPRQERREIQELEAQDARASLDEARQSAVNTLQEAFTDAQDAVLSRADDFFRNARTYRPYLIPSSATLAQSNELEAERVELLTLFRQWGDEVQNAAPDEDLEALLTRTQERLQFIKQFLDLLQNVVSDQETRSDLTQSDINAQEASVDAAITTINGAVSDVIAARTALTNKRSALSIAQQRLAETQSGERPEDIAAAKAQVTQAQGRLQAVRAALEKKLVRTPISGTVSTLSIEQGDFVQNGRLLARITSAGARKVELSVSERARNRIALGDEAVVAGAYAGRVTSLEPGLSPSGRQADVTVGLREAAPTLTIGDIVSVTIKQNDEASATIDEIAIPVTALKILPTRTVVFEISDQGALVARDVTPGAITGERIIIREGLAPEDVIVTDVRGLSEGQKVTTRRAP